MQKQPQISITGIFTEEKGGGFTAQFKEIPNAIAQGETIEEAQSNLFNVLFMVLADMAEIESQDPCRNQDDDNRIIRTYPINMPA